jgi:PAS domain S-box-containing protein
MTINESHRRESETLAALFELDLLHGEAFPDLDRLVLLANDICGGNIAALTVHDAERAYQISTSYGTRETIPKTECLCTVSLARNQTVVVPDCRVDRRMAQARYVVGEPFVRSLVSAPVGADPDLPIGVLAIGHTEPGRFGPREIDRLERVAELVNVFLSQRCDATRARRAAAKTDAERFRQSQFELIFEAMQEGVNVYSADGRIVDSNPAAMEFLSLTRDEQIGRITGDPRWKIVNLDGSHFPEEDYPILRALRWGETAHDVQMGVGLPGGERRWISVNAAPVRDPETDAISHAVMTFKDITAQHEAELQIVAQNARLGEALEQAEKANRAKTDFMGVMSHELRTPMNAVLSCALLLSQSKLDPVQRRTLGVLDDAGRQMLAVLNDLLDLSSLNADKVRINREPVSLVRLIEDAAVIWASEVKAKGLSMQVMIDPALVTPREVDSARLLQIIGNLMANAVKFTTSGGITIQAWPQGRQSTAKRIAIEVEDTGPGVPPEAIERIFSPFEQADVSTKRRHGGLGLGLHVARRLAMAMGGDVELETQLDQGSRFRVHIDAPLSEAPAQPVRPSTPANDQGEAQGKQILCVDDNSRNLYVLGAMLRAAGHQVVEVGSGAEALAKLAERKFDVILLDMVMPEMDGFGVLERLRRMETINRKTPVIACTANVLPDQVESYKQAGTVGVLAKPIDIRAMLQAVASATQPAAA